MERVYSILYLEDERWQIEGTTTTVLRKEFNTNVCIIKSVIEARDFLKREHFDLLIFDIMVYSKRAMTFENSALVLVQELIKGDFKPINDENTPIIFASAFLDITITRTETDGSVVAKQVSDIIKDMGIENPIFLFKPFSKEELIEKVKEAIHHE